MAAELEKLAQELKARGFEVGGHLVSDFTKSLKRRGLIPPDLHDNQESVGEAELPRDTFPLDLDELGKLDVPGTRDFLRDQGVSLKLTNLLYRRKVTVAQLATASDEELVKIRDLGRKSLKEVRSLFPRPLPRVSPDSKEA